MLSLHVMIRPIYCEDFGDYETLHVYVHFFFTEMLGSSDFRNLKISYRGTQKGNKLGQIRQQIRVKSNICLVLN